MKPMNPQARIDLLKRTDQMFADIKASCVALATCLTPHDFSICIDLRTNKPIEGEPTRNERFMASWRCSKCGGQVGSVEKNWYEKGVKDGKAETVFQARMSGKGKV